MWETLEIQDSVVPLSKVFVEGKRCIVAKHGGTCVYHVSSTYQRTN